MVKPNGSPTLISNPSNWNWNQICKRVLHVWKHLLRLRSFGWHPGFFPTIDYPFVWNLFRTIRVPNPPATKWLPCHVHFASSLKSCASFQLSQEWRSMSATFQAKTILSQTTSAGGMNSNQCPTPLYRPTVSVFHLPIYGSIPWSQASFLVVSNCPGLFRVEHSLAGNPSQPILGVLRR